MGDDATMAPVETVRPRLTFADLERMPDDGRRYELYDGEVVVGHSRAAFTAPSCVRLETTGCNRRYLIGSDDGP
jgi:hypothetical protein